MISLENLYNIENFNIENINVNNDKAINNYLAYLTYLHTHKPLIDIEKQKPKNKHGFYACTNNHNPQHNKNKYSIAETKIKQILDKHNIEYLHEYKIKVFNGKRHKFYCDFYIPKKRIDLEINPEFHKTFKLVFLRDQLRKRLLAKHNINVITINVKHYRKTKNQNVLIPIFDRKEIKKAIEIIQKTPISKDILDYYF